jgi:uncharacterized membrane protein YgcG
MQGTPVGRSKPRNWKDVQLIISSISVALSLGLWSTWASRDKAEAAPAAPKATMPTTEAVTATPMPLLLPGQILYLATAGPQTNAPVSSEQKPKRRKGGDGGGGGGGGGGGAADAGTGSS